PLCAQSYGLHYEKKNHTYYEQDPEKVALFLKNFNSLKHLAPV
ncbi:50S ribosomal protein L33, partial [Streptococcus pneumoniae GA04672]